MIRRATTEDLDEIARLELQLFPDNSFSPLMLERQALVSPVLVIGEPVIAYAMLGIDGAMLDLLRLGVHPEQQGKGLGEALLKHVLAWGRDVVLSVRKDNHRALRLYTKHGFKVVGHFEANRAWALFREAVFVACPSPPL